MTTNRLPKNAYRVGFTLVELLVTIGIIMVLVAILLPAINAARESSRSSACLNNLRQFGVAMHERAIRHGGNLTTGAWDWEHDGAVTSRGWVADLVNSGTPVGKMLCPSNPRRLSAVFNQLNDLDPASFDNCVDRLGALTITLPDGQPLANVCRMIEQSSLAADSDERRSLVERLVFQKHYNTNYIASWQLARSEFALDANGHLKPTKPSCGSSPLSLNVTLGPLTEARSDASTVGSSHIPLLADGGGSEQPRMSFGDDAGPSVVETMTPGPVLMTTMSVPNFSSGTPTSSPGSWSERWNSQTRQDYRLFAPVHRGDCNVLFADGSIRAFTDKNRDGLLNSGFPAGNGFADDTIELPPREIHTLYSLRSRLPQ